LLAMMIFETGQRQFTDQPAGTAVRQPHWLGRSAQAAKRG